MGQKITHLVPEYLRTFGPMPVLFIKGSMVTKLTRLQFILWSLKVPMFQWLLQLPLLPSKPRLLDLPIVLKFLWLLCQHSSLVDPGCRCSTVSKLSRKLQMCFALGTFPIFRYSLWGNVAGRRSNLNSTAAEACDLSNPIFTYSKTLILCHDVLHRDCNALILCTFNATFSRIGVSFYSKITVHEN